MSHSSAVSRLQRWYAARADGTWEHSYGICIETLDNPGWHVSIDLVGTVHENTLFVDVMHNP